MGIKPGVILWNCIMHNAIDASEYDEAWRWYDTGIADGLKPDQITFSVLLRMAKYSHADTFIDRVVEEATQKGILPHNDWLVFDVLHAIYLNERSKLALGPERTYDAMLSFYSQHRDLGPLRDLGLHLGYHTAEIEQDRELLMPAPRVVGLMLLGYLSQFGKDGDPDILQPLYSQYHSLLEAKHPIVKPLGSTDHVSNAFVKAFGKRSDGLSHCTLVIKNMLTRTAAIDPEFELSRNTTPGQTGKPTVQTWNILLRSYMNHRRTEAAGKILSMMRIRGIKPDVVTWNHVLEGYVRTQDVPKVVSASRRMRDAGIEYNDFTIQALRRLVDKGRYLKAMEDQPSAKDEPIVMSSEFPDAVGQERMEVVDSEKTTHSDTRMSEAEGITWTTRAGADGDWQEDDSVTKQIRTPAEAYLQTTQDPKAAALARSAQLFHRKVSMPMSQVDEGAGTENGTPSAICNTEAILEAPQDAYDRSSPPYISESIRLLQPQSRSSRRCRMSTGLTSFPIRPSTPHSSPEENLMPLPAAHRESSKSTPSKRHFSTFGRCFHRTDYDVDELNEARLRSPDTPAQPQQRLSDHIWKDIESHALSQEYYLKLSSHQSFRRVPVLEYGGPGLIRRIPQGSKWRTSEDLQEHWARTEAIPRRTVDATSSPPKRSMNQRETPKPPHTKTYVPPLREPHDPDLPQMNREERHLYGRKKKQVLREWRAYRSIRRHGVDDAWEDAVEWVNDVAPAPFFEWKCESEHQDGVWSNEAAAADFNTRVPGGKGVRGEQGRSLRYIIG